MGAEFCSRRFASKYLFKQFLVCYIRICEKKLSVKGEILEKKLIKDAENSLLLIDIHVKLQCIFSNFLAVTPIFHNGFGFCIPKIGYFGNNLDFIKKNSKIFQNFFLRMSRFLPKLF